MIMINLVNVSHLVHLVLIVKTSCMIADIMMVQNTLELVRKWMLPMEFLCLPLMEMKNEKVPTTMKVNLLFENDPHPHN